MKISTSISYFPPLKSREDLYPSLQAFLDAVVIEYDCQKWQERETGDKEEKSVVRGHMFSSTLALVLALALALALLFLLDFQTVSRAAAPEGQCLVKCRGYFVRLLVLPAYMFSI